MQAADQPRRPTPSSYALAVVVTGAVALARGALDPSLREQAILLPFVLAVLTAAVTGGLGPGLVATGVAMMVAMVAFVEPRGSLALADMSDVVQLAVFGGVSVVICLLSHRLNQARAHAVQFCRELKDSHEQLRAIADSMPHFVWSARPDGRVEFFNQRWSEYTGMSSTLDPEADWTRHVNEEDRARVADAWRRSMATGEPFDVEFRVPRVSDGASRWFLGRALPSATSAATPFAGSARAPTSTSAGGSPRRTTGAWTRARCARAGRDGHAPARRIRGHAGARTANAAQRHPRVDADAAAVHGSRSVRARSSRISPMGSRSSPAS